MEGACLCKSVIYEFDGQPDDVYCCHCRACQVASGSAFHVLGIVAKNRFRLLKGALSIYETQTDSGYLMSREFCPACGTPLFLKSTRFRGIVMFTVSSLSDARRLAPRFEIWTSEKQDWADLQKGLESFPRGLLD